MAVSIDNCFSLLKYRANKAGYNGYISPDDFNLVFPRAEVRYFNKLYGNQNDYQPGRPVPRISYAGTQKISESLSKFISNPEVVVVDADGKYTIPDDVLHIDSIMYTNSGTPVEVVRVEKDRLANNLSSKYDAPSTEFPIYTEYNGYLQFYPLTSASVTFTYLKRPTTSVWGYNLISNRPVYAASLSTQPQWSDTDIDEIIYIALSDIAQNMKDGELGNFAERKINTGI